MATSADPVKDCMHPTSSELDNMLIKFSRLMAAHTPLVLLAVSGQGIALLVLSILRLGLEEVEDSGLVLLRLVEDVGNQVPKVEGVDGLHRLDGDDGGAGCRSRCQLSSLSRHDNSGVDAAVAGSLQGTQIISQPTGNSQHTLQLLKAGTRAGGHFKLQCKEEGCAVEHSPQLRRWRRIC